jgi:hypothetical protein
VRADAGGDHSPQRLHRVRQPKLSPHLAKVPFAGGGSSHHHWNERDTTPLLSGDTMIKPGPKPAATDDELDAIGRELHLEDKLTHREHMRIARQRFGAASSERVHASRHRVVSGPGKGATTQRSGDPADTEQLRVPRLAEQLLQGYEADVREAVEAEAAVWRQAVHNLRQEVRRLTQKLERSARAPSPGRCTCRSNGR